MRFRAKWGAKLEGVKRVAKSPALRCAQTMAFVLGETQLEVRDVPPLCARVTMKPRMES